ncbi:MAG: acetyl-CoA carboxylase biotin carboxyl carrier protein [Rhodospirillaceae bacterium]
MSKVNDDKSTSNDEIRDDLVRQLADILDETNLSEIEYETSALKIRVARQKIIESYGNPLSPGMTQPKEKLGEPSDEESSQSDPMSHPGTVKAPMVGVAYLSGEPDTPPFIKVGDVVAEGQTLMLIEAMKTFNPVRAARAGTVVAVLVSDGQPIEFDQPLVTID